MVLTSFKTPERVCWNDDKAGRTFFVVANTDSTAKWKANPKLPVEDIVYSSDIFSYTIGNGGFSRVASSEELEQTFKTTDQLVVVKSILSAGTVYMKEFELDVDSQATNAMNAASSAATVASSAANNALEGVKGYLSGFW